MTFDTKAFNKATFKRRTAEVDVTALSAFFKSDKDAEQTGAKNVFIVQGLTHHEIAESKDSLTGQDNLKSILEAVSASKPALQAAVTDLIKSKVNLPQDTQLKIKHLVFGCVDPVIDEITAVRIAERFPVEFIGIASKIMELTGLGQEAIKKR